MARSVHPEDRERVLATYRAADAARSGFEMDYRVLSAEGEVRHQALLALDHAASPATILNVTGPTISIREVAEKFGELFGKQPVFAGQDSGRAFLSDSSRATALFGPPAVPVDRVIQWTAQWISSGGRSLGKPTHFETQDGKY